MEFIPLDVTLISATDLKDVNLMSKMDVYAVASISGGGAKQKTPVDKDCGPNPRWNHTVRFLIPDAQLKQGHHGLSLNIKLVSDRSFGDKEIGEVNVPLSELLESPASGERSMTYAVRMKNGKTKGSLSFSYKIGDKFTKAPEPVMAYPAPGSTSYGAAPPAPGAYPYPYPAQGGYPPQQKAGYGYQMPPPPLHQGGYAYPGQYPGQFPGHAYPMAAPPHKPKRNGNMALGLGAGLLGGLLIGDMVSDVASYDAGYDAGFDDGGGFDF